MKLPPVLLTLIVLSGCSKDGDTTIINQDIVPADPIPKAWRIPEMLGTANASSASTGDVRFDAAGNAIVVFLQQGVWAQRWTPAAGWGPLERISDSSPFGSGVKLAVDAAGNAIAVYSQLDDPSGGSETSIWWNRYAVGTGWGTPALLESDDLIAGDAQIAGNTAGDAVVVWGASDGASSDLFYNRYVAGTGWTGAAPLEDGPDVAGSARLGMDATGIANAVWLQGAGGADSNVVSARYVPGTGWTATVPLETVSDYATAPEIAVNAAGDALAIWIQIPSSIGNLWAAAYRPATGWGAPTLVENENLSSVLGGLQVGIDATGAGTAAWGTFDGTSDKVWSGRFSPAAGWTSVEPLGELTNGVGARLAVSSSGATGIVWLHQDGVGINGLFSSHDGAGPWTPPVWIEFYEFQCDNPVLAFDGSGNGMAIWSYYHPIGGFRTWVNRYD